MLKIYVATTTETMLVSNNGYYTKKHISIPS